jgi:DNA end-binding protein Ku
MPEAAPEEGKVVDLMDALRRSVAEAKKQRGEGDGAAQESGRAPAKKAAAKKASAKKAPAKKASAKKTAAKRKSA